MDKTLDIALSSMTSLHNCFFNNMKLIFDPEPKSLFYYTSSRDDDDVSLSFCLSDFLFLFLFSIIIRMAISKFQNTKLKNQGE